jgi:hypothetical protein
MHAQGEFKSLRALGMHARLMPSIRRGWCPVSGSYCQSAAFAKDHESDGTDEGHTQW